MTDAPRVLHLVIALEPGGLERCVIEWTRWRNVQSPNSTFVLCMDQAGQLGELNPDIPISVCNARRGGLSGRFRMPAEIKTFISRHKIDILHTHNIASLLHAARVRQPQLKHVHTQHGEDPGNDTAPINKQAKLAAQRVDRLAVVSEGVGQMAQTRLGLTDDEFSLIPNGVLANTSEDRDPLKLPQLSDNDFVIASLGRLEHVKGFDRLISAFAELFRLRQSRGSTIPLKLIIAGDGSQHNALRALCVELGVTESVLMPGFISDPHQLLDRADVYVQPSRSEGLPIAVLEAMSMGCPTIVSPVGAMPQLVSEKAGWILPDDETQWGGFLDEVCDAEDSGARTQNAKHRIASYYSLESTCSAYEGLYTDVLGESR